MESLNGQKEKQGGNKNAMLWNLKDIFKNDHIDIDIDIDIFQKCRYIDNRYSLSIYRTGLWGSGLCNGAVDSGCHDGFRKYMV